MLFKILGAIGMIMISYGIITKNSSLHDWLFIGGGILLLIYSISLRDPIFIPLQIIFIIASVYKFYKTK
ncbi:MAG: hypothetical protein HYT15_00590 [Candidatus Magasanikbacteria bacterium]|nr:hypothetical protein [Candidatus Magasanikbacteria bacterium]